MRGPHRPAGLDILRFSQHLERSQIGNAGASGFFKLWSTLMDRAASPYTIAVASIAAANGVIGAWTSWRSNRHPFGPVLWVPILLLLFFLTIVNYPGVVIEWGGDLFLAVDPDDNDWKVIWVEWLFLMAVTFGLFVWMAGAPGRKWGLGDRARPNQLCQAQPSKPGR